MTGTALNHTTNVTTRVQQFVEQARSGALTKSDGTLSVDSAEWYVEAALNYSVAKAWLEFSDVVADSAEVTLSLSGDAVTSASAYAAFNTLHAALAGVEEEGVQHVAIVDVAAKVTGAELRLDVRYLVGSGYEKTLNTYYAPGEDLWYTDQGSACGCGTVSSALCADKKIQQRVQAAIQVPMGPYDYWTNVETWSVGPYDTHLPSKYYKSTEFPNPNNTTGDHSQDFLVLYCLNDPCDPCLSSDALSHLTQGSYDVLMDIKANHCLTKTPYAITLDGDFVLGGGSGAILHHATYTYGNKQTGGSS